MIECEDSITYRPSRTLCRASSYSSSNIRGSLRILKKMLRFIQVSPSTRSYLIFSSSFFEKNTFRRSMVIGSFDSFSSSFPWLCLSSSLDHATRTAYGRWCGFSCTSSSGLVIQRPNTLCASNLLVIPNSSQPSAAASMTWAGHCAVPSISICTAMRDIRYTTVGITCNKKRMISRYFHNNCC